jgi:hypothetical protein
MAGQIEMITSNVVESIREVMKTAQDLEALVLQNAARVKVELDEHVELAMLVKKEASQLGEVIGKLREVQAQVAVERKNGQQH